MNDPFDFEALRHRLPGTPEENAEPSPAAAVAAVLRTGLRGPEVLFIQRAEQPGDPWSGHMAFPGGHREPDDRTLEDTAVRETVEELGLDLRRDGQSLARLPDLPTYKGRLVVRGFVFSVREHAALAPNHAEVAAVHWTPLEPLLRGERDTHMEAEWKGQRLRFPGYQVGERIVWGLTYRMLQYLIDGLR